MAFDEDLADRIRELLADYIVTERKMFGGLAFLFGGNMGVAVLGEDSFMVRVDPDVAVDLVASGRADPMIMQGRRLRGWVRAGSGVDDAELADLVGRGAAFADGLPAKKPG